MIHRNLISRTVLFAIAATALGSQAHARVGQICLELPAGAGVVKAEIASGCLPTHPQYEGAFRIAVDPDRATIAIDGGFTQIGDSQIASADCMGSRVVEQEAEAAGPRRYSVTVNGEYRGVIDASDTMFGMRAVRECFEGPSQNKIARPEQMTIFMREQFADWIARPQGKPADPIYRDTYATLAQAAAALIGNHPESMEGRPSVEVTILQGEWRRKPWDKLADRRFMAIRVEEHGYLDDSVSGRRQFATAQRNNETGEWRITDHWQQFMCAREERAGQWSGEPCA